jgi:hypothetical protein
MKHSIVFVCILALVGCTTLYPVAPAGQGACEKTPDAVLCKIFAKVGMTAEQTDSMLLDATLVPVAAKVMDAKELRSAIDKVSTWVDTHEITMNTLIKYLVTEAELDPALAMLLSRRLVNLTNVPDLGSLYFDPVSVEMVKAHLRHQKEQFSWF